MNIPNYVPINKTLFTKIEDGPDLTVGYSLPTLKLMNVDCLVLQACTKLTELCESMRACVWNLYIVFQIIPTLSAIEEFLWGRKSDVRKDCNSHNPSRSWLNNSVLKLKREGLKDSRWWDAEASTKDSAIHWRARLVWEHCVSILIEKACDQGQEGHVCLSSHEDGEGKKMTWIP